MTTCGSVTTSVSDLCVTVKDRKAQRGGNGDQDRQREREGGRGKGIETWGRAGTAAPLGLSRK